MVRTSKIYKHATAAKPMMASVKVMMMMFFMIASSRRMADSACQSMMP
jgi:hypothetical protein